MYKAIVLVRVSTFRQETEEQRKETMDFAMEKYSEEEILVIENKESATQKEELEGIKEMEAAILNPSNDIKEVLVWEFSRISRIGRYAEQIRNFLTDHKINLRTKKGEYSLFNEAGEMDMEKKMMFDMWKNISEEEGEKRIARLKRGKRAAAQKNRYLGGKVCYGYKINKETKAYEIDPVEGEAVKSIFDLYSSGKYGQKGLYEELSRNGISIKKSQIIKILMGEHFTGKVVNRVSGRKKVFEYQYPQLVSDELYNRCREIVDGKVNRKCDKQNKFKFYANRVVKCAECGKYLYAVLSNNKGLYCYTCSKNRYLPEGETKCIGGVNISVKIIDSLALYYAYRAQMIELATDRTESINRAKQAIVDLQGKIAKAGEQYEILKSAKRKKLKKELSFIVGNEFEMLLERAMSNDKKRIDREVIEWQDQIRKHNTYISDQGDIQAKYNMRIKGQKSIVLLDSPMLHYHEFSEQERYDLVHKYVTEILCRKVEKNCVEITINLISGFSKKIFYHNRQKVNDKKLTDQNNNPLSWAYYILG